MANDFLTVEQVEMEIKRLRNDPNVKLAHMEQRIKKRRKTLQKLQRIEKRGKQIQQMGVTYDNMGAVYSGQLLSSVDGYFSPLLNAGFIRVNNEYAVFVEFGTGVVGQQHPHTNGEYLSKASWAYATGPKIITTQDGRIGWFYPTDDGGYRFTEGMESRPFMYETALQLQREFPQIAREVFA